MKALWPLLATLALTLLSVLVATGVTIALRRTDLFRDIDWGTAICPEAEATASAKGKEVSS